VLERAACGSAAAARAVAEPANGQGARAIAGQGGHQLLEQRFEMLALVVSEHVKHVFELRRAVGQNARGGVAAFRGQVQGAGAPVGTLPALQQAVPGKTVDDLDRRRLGDPQHVGQGLHRVTRVGVEVHERGGVGAGAAQRRINARAHAVDGTEREGAEELGEAIGHTLYITRLCISQTCGAVFSGPRGSARGGLGRLDDPFDLEVRLSGLLQIVEQPYAISQRDGRQVELDLVEQSLVECLVDDAGTSVDLDVLAARGLPCPFDRGVDAVRDEGEGRTALALQRLAGRIVYTYELYAGEALASVSVASVVFVADGDGTLLTVTEQIAVLDGRDTRAARERGVTSLLRRLGAALD
jgi:hypothetical protein